jgi:hypothetical protein
VIYVRSVLAGIVAVLAVCVIRVGFVVLPLAFMMMRSAATGSGGIGAVSTGVVEPLILLVPLAFAGGFYWDFRRASKRRSI